MTEPNPSRSAPSWIRYGVACVMATWATGHLITVQITRASSAQTQEDSAQRGVGLSTWRGGGFGMYAGFHPVQNDAWVTASPDDPPQRFWKHSKEDSKLYRVVRPHLTFPRPDALRDDLSKLDDPPQKTEITGLKFDVASGELSRRQLLLIESEGNQ